VELQAIMVGTGTSLALKGMVNVFREGPKITGHKII
jgi:hypothetical protein